MLDLNLTVPHVAGFALRAADRGARLFCERLEQTPSIAPDLTRTGCARVQSKRNSPTVMRCSDLLLAEMDLAHSCSLSLPLRAPAECPLVDGYLGRGRGFRATEGLRASREMLVMNDAEVSLCCQIRRDAAT
jgi:hypothetical protein